jgi:hypothetical protein
MLPCRTAANRALGPLRSPAWLALCSGRRSEPTHSLRLRETEGVPVEIQRLLAQVGRRPPGDQAGLERLVDCAGIRLPDDYLAFMASSDGGEGDVAKRWIEIWPVNRVLAQLVSQEEFESRGYERP